MTVQEILDTIKAKLANVDIVDDQGNHMIFYNPDPEHVDRRMPFTTIVTNNAYDTASNLERDSIFRINIGVKQTTYRERFGLLPKPAPDWGLVDTGYDYTQLDQLMPHPIYAAMGWVCVLNPSRQTWEEVLPLIAEAYEQAERQRTKRHTRPTPLR